MTSGFNLTLTVSCLYVPTKLFHPCLRCVRAMARDRSAACVPAAAVSRQGKYARCSRSGYTCVQSSRKEDKKTVRYEDSGKEGFQRRNR